MNNTLKKILIQYFKDCWKRLKEVPYILFFKEIKK